MKLSEIQVGKTYTDGKGHKRLVLELYGVHFVLYRFPRGVQTYLMRLSTFCRWAKSEVK